MTGDGRYLSHDADELEAGAVDRQLGGCIGDVGGVAFGSVQGRMMGKRSRLSSKRGEDPVSAFKDQAKWSSFTNSSRFSGRPWGWHWPLRARQLLAVLLVGALFFAAVWVAINVLRLFA